MDHSLLTLTVQIKSTRIPSSTVRMVEKDAHTLWTTTANCNEYCQLECKKKYEAEIQEERSRGCTVLAAWSLAGRDQTALKWRERSLPQAWWTFWQHSYVFPGAEPEQVHPGMKSWPHIKHNHTHMPTRLQDVVKVYTCSLKKNQKWSIERPTWTISAKGPAALQ